MYECAKLLNEKVEKFINSNSQSNCWKELLEYLLVLSQVPMVLEALFGSSLKAQALTLSFLHILLRFLLIPIFAA